MHVIVDERRVKQTERDVYRAAVELIYERGYHATSLRTVARAVGVQMSSLYYYFPSKQAMLVEIMTRSMEELIAAVEAEVASAGPEAESRLCAAIRGHILFHAERRKEAFILDSELRALERAGQRLVVKLRDRYEEIFLEILEDGAARKTLYVPDLKLIVFALLAMCTGVASWYKPGGRYSLEQIAEIYAGLALNGLLITQGVRVVPSRDAGARGAKTLASISPAEEIEATRERC